MQPTREQILRLAIQHSDQQQYSRERTLDGFNFSKSGLLDFACEVRKLAATPEEAEAERWKSHVRMERHFYDPTAEHGSGENKAMEIGDAATLKAELRDLHAVAVATARENGATDAELAAVSLLRVGGAQDKSPTMDDDGALTAAYLMARKCEREACLKVIRDCATKWEGPWQRAAEWLAAAIDQRTRLPNSQQGAASS